MAYTLNPTPVTGKGAYGLVPGALTLPDPFADLSKVAPWLAGTNAKAGGVLNSQLSGQISPETLNMLQDTAAARSVSSGMPGANAVAGSLPFNAFLRGVGQTAEQLQQQGLVNYSNLIPTISQTQTVNPALQTEVAATNAATAAMPDPAAAAAQEQSLLDKYMSMLQGPAGGTISNLPDNFVPQFAPIQRPRYMTDPYNYAQEGNQLLAMGNDLGYEEGF